MMRPLTPAQIQRLRHLELTGEWTGNVVTRAKLFRRGLILFDSPSRGAQVTLTDAGRAAIAPPKLRELAP